MDIVWISAAFLFGFGARAIGLPPLVGYLVTGFVLYAFGVRSGEALAEFAELGVTLLLFTIGLKLRLSSLLMPQIWGVASLHMIASVLFGSVGLLAFATSGLQVFTGLDVPTSFLIAFALSFSSTVFAVKVLEEKGEMNALYGRVAIGILIVQDIAAVVFLAASTGKVPSPWALLLLGLIPARPLLYKLLDRAGHGELLILLGLTLALGGAWLFDQVGVKGDLGALLIGVMLARHPQSSQIARQLLGFKDLFLVGFFLSIGLTGLPSPAALGAAALLLLALPIKMVWFFWFMVRFHLRSRTAFLGALSLTNYSEFGLIVGAIAVSAGWLSTEWLSTLAVTLAASLVLAAPFNTVAHNLYDRYRKRLSAYELDSMIPEERDIDPGDAEVLIFGMGRVGTGAYDAMRERFGDTVLGLDLDDEQVDLHIQQGRRVLRASAMDPDFWDRFNLATDTVQLVMLALPNHREILFAAAQLKSRGYRGRIAAIAKYPSEIAALHEAGVDAAVNLYAEAGLGFANDVCRQLVPDGTVLKR